MTTLQLIEAAILQLEELFGEVKVFRFALEKEDRTQQSEMCREAIMDVISKLQAAHQAIVQPELPFEQTNRDHVDGLADA